MNFVEECIKEFMVEGTCNKRGIEGTQYITVLMEHYQELVEVSVITDTNSDRAMFFIDEYLEANINELIDSVMSCS